MALVIHLIKSSHIIVQVGPGIGNGQNQNFFLGQVLQSSPVQTEQRGIVSSSIEKIMSQNGVRRRLHNRGSALGQAAVPPVQLFLPDPLLRAVLVQGSVLMVAQQSGDAAVKTSRHILNYFVPSHQLKGGGLFALCGIFLCDLIYSRIR